MKILQNPSTMSPWKSIGEIFLPFALYYILHDAAALGLLLLLRGSALLPETGELTPLLSGLVNSLAMLAGMLPLLPMASREIQDRKQAAGQEEKAPRRIAAICTWLMLVIGAAGLSLGLNILFSLTGLTERSAAYEQVARQQFGTGLVAGLLFYGIISPLAEEVVFRAVIYNRLRKRTITPIAMVAGGILFGLYHGNLVQGIYGSLLGIALAWVYEKRDSFFAPLLFHSVANILVFTVGNLPDLAGNMMKWSWGLSLSGVGILFCILGGRTDQGTEKVDF